MKRKVSLYLKNFRRGNRQLVTATHFKMQVIYFVYNGVPFHRNFNSILRRDHQKNSYERRTYESVDE